MRSTNIIYTRTKLTSNSQELNDISGCHVVQLDGHWLINRDYKENYNSNLLVPLNAKLFSKVVRHRIINILYYGIYIEANHTGFIIS